MDSSLNSQFYAVYKCSLG